MESNCISDTRPTPRSIVLDWKAPTDLTTRLSHLSLDHGEPEKRHGPPLDTRGNTPLKGGVPPLMLTLTTTYVSIILLTN